VIAPNVSAVLAALAGLCLVGTVRAVVVERVRLPERRPDASPPPSARWRRSLHLVGANPGLRRLAGLDREVHGEAELLGAASILGGAASLALLLAPTPAPLLAPIMMLLALRAPRFVEGRALRARRRAVDAELTQFLDALAAASTAGLSASLGIRRAAEVVRGPLRQELDHALRAVELGARWREELRSLAERSGVPDLRRAVAVITRTETLGSSLASSTVELADRVRAGRRQRATERARTAPVKMLFPLVFLVLPAFLLLTVVPVLLTTLQSIR
jgi:pilus assembly protein TadC